MSSATADPFFIFEVTPTDGYQQALDYIYSFIDHERQPGPRSRVTYDLRRMDDLLARVGEPHLAPATVHVAGSKGKGSVAAMIASALTASDYRTGLFTSPHLHFVNERMRIDGQPVPDDELVHLVDRLRPEIEAVNDEAKHGRLTTFEILTALGFLHFATRAVDFQVIEVGLGGTLDATNVVRPEVAVITSISLEHTDVLGDTIAEIATEKAGIVKPGCPAVVSPQVAEAATVIEAVCRRQGAELIRVAAADSVGAVTWRDPAHDADRQTFRVTGRRAAYELSIPLLGRYQLDNAAAAVAALEVLTPGHPGITVDSIKAGLASVEWEGRLQVLNRRPLLVVDGAHNADSARKLCQSLTEYFDYRRAALIVGLSADKDLPAVVDELVPHFDDFIVTRSIHPRAMDTGPIVAEFARRGIEARETGDISEALPLALGEAGDSDLVCVTGSLFVVAGAIEQAVLLSLAV